MRNMCRRVDPLPASFYAAVSESMLRICLSTRMVADYAIMIRNIAKVALITPLITRHC